MPKSLRHSCRSELHVRPRFPAAQTIRSPDRSESRARSISRPGPASYEAFQPHPGISPPESLRGPDPSGLTLGIARGALQTPVGFHRFELEVWTGSLPSRAVSSTRQGISLDLVAPSALASLKGPDISAGLCMSPCSPDFIFELISADQIVWR